MSIADIRNHSLGTLTMVSTTTVVSTPLKLQQSKCLAVQAVWTGTPVGNFKLQISCDSYDTNPANWVDLASTTVAAGGAVGSHIYNITDAGYGWVRVSYTNSSGDGSAEIRATVKGV